MKGNLFTAVSSDLAVTQMEVYGSGREFPGGKASSVMTLRPFLRSFDLRSTLGDDLGTNVDVYESVDLPLGGTYFQAQLYQRRGFSCSRGSGRFCIALLL